MKNFRKIITVVFLVGAIAGLTYIVKTYNLSDQPERAIVKTNSKIKDQTIVLKDYVRYPGKDGRTAFDLLMDVTKSNVEFKRYDFGVYVESINGVKPPSNQFWKLYVNAEEAQVGSDKLSTHRGDIVEWLIEDINGNSSSEKATSTSK